METPTSFTGLVNGILDIINIIIPTIFTVLFVFMVWKIIDAWIINAGDETKRSEGKMYIVVAVIAFVLIISTWGIVALIKTSFLGG